MTRPMRDSPAPRPTSAPYPAMAASRPPTLPTARPPATRPSHDAARAARRGHRAAAALRHLDGTSSSPWTRSSAGWAPAGYGLTVGPDAILLRAAGPTCCCRISRRNCPPELSAVRSPGCRGGCRASRPRRAAAPWRGRCSTWPALPARAFLRRFVDLLALHKLNVLHLHLTDDQGWRVEIKRYPRLTEIGAWRPRVDARAGRAAPFDGRPHGGFYTQDDLREIVAYAASRYITVVPEIDMPGHTQAAIAAYPELGNPEHSRAGADRWGIVERAQPRRDTILEFCRNVLDEITGHLPRALRPHRRRRVPPRRGSGCRCETAQLGLRELGLPGAGAARALVTRRMADSHLTGGDAASSTGTRSPVRRGHDRDDLAGRGERPARRDRARLDVCARARPHLTSTIRPTHPARRGSRSPRPDAYGSPRPRRPAGRAPGSSGCSARALEREYSPRPRGGVHGVPPPVRLRQVAWGTGGDYPDFPRKAQRASPASRREASRRPLNP